MREHEALEGWEPLRKCDRLVLTGMQEMKLGEQAEAELYVRPVRTMNFLLRILVLSTGGMGASFVL